jgi:hypothetical protein
LIIGGTTKAATTSLFMYLAAHPRICAASLKETRFFLDRDYPLFSRWGVEDGLEKYEGFFRHCQDGLLRLEATPDYLYSPGAPEKIKASLPNVKLIFILREPVSRLMSWYRFAKQTGRLPERTSFQEFIALQSHEGRQSDQQLQVLEQGCYSKFLRAYFELFDPSRIHIVFYEDLSENPARVLRSVCDFAALDSEFYSNFSFEVFNRTTSMKNSSFHGKYIQMRLRLRRFTHNKPAIHQALRRIKMLIEPLYLRVNTKAAEETTASASFLKMLSDFYAPERKALAELLRIPLPAQWDSTSSP